MRIVGIIPARMASSRFPGKPLAPILGKSMIEHVYRRSALCEDLEEVYVATCDREIAYAVESFGGHAIMTSDVHERASDRVAEAVADLEADVVVMIQGDEPMTTPVMIGQALEPFRQDPGVVCSNLALRIEDLDEFTNPNTIKVVADRRGNALYFSRSPIPYQHLLGFEGIEVWKQVCVIPFTRDFLLEYASLDPTPFERAESVDMLRILEHGYDVRLAPTQVRTIAVDHPEDVTRVEALLNEDPLLDEYAPRA